MECVTYLRISKNDTAKESMLTESAVLKDTCNSNNATDSIKNQKNCLNSIFIKMVCYMSVSLLMKDIRVQILTDLVLQICSNGLKKTMSSAL